MSICAVTRGGREGGEDARGWVVTGLLGSSSGGVDFRSFLLRVIARGFPFFGGIRRSGCLFPFKGERACHSHGRISLYSTVHRMCIMQTTNLKMVAISTSKTG